jgi:hypothetical protein
MPTKSVLVVRYTLVPPSVQPVKALADDPQVRTPATVVKEQVANEESANEIPVPLLPALKVTVSEVASPKVVFPLMLALPVTFKVAVETELPATMLPVVLKLVAVPDERIVLPVTEKLEAVPDVKVVA